MVRINNREGKGLKDIKGEKGSKRYKGREKVLEYIKKGKGSKRCKERELLWTPTYGRAKAERPARTYIQQLCEDTGCSPEDLPEAMNDREKWREKVRDIPASGMT